MNDLVKVVTVTNDTMLVSLAVVSQAWLDKLPPDLQKIVIDTAQAVQPKMQAWEVEFLRSWRTIGSKWAGGFTSCRLRTSPK